MTVRQPPIRVGVIGCGEIAQLVHLPLLSKLDRFDVRAVCDLSGEVVSGLQQKYAIERGHASADDVLSDRDIDAVVICTYDHAELVLAAIAADKHVLVEKPMAFTVSEATAIADAAGRSDRTFMVGYMKLFDAAFDQARKVLEGLGPARTRTMHDLAGRFDWYGELYDLIRPVDLAADSRDAQQRVVKGRIAAELAGGAEYVDLYLLLLMLGSHDLACVRAAFGVPDSIEYVHAIGATQLTAVLGYRDAAPCTLRIGVGTQYDWWDEWLAVDTDLANLRVDFAHPYVVNAVSSLAVRDARQGGDVRTTFAPRPTSAFEAELLHFAVAIDGQVEARSEVNAAAGLADVRLATDLIGALAQSQAALR